MDPSGPTTPTQSGGEGSTDTGTIRARASSSSTSPASPPTPTAPLASTVPTAQTSIGRGNPPTSPQQQQQQPLPPTPTPKGKEHARTQSAGASSILISGGDSPARPPGILQNPTPLPTSAQRQASTVTNRSSTFGMYASPYPRQAGETTETESLASDDVGELSDVGYDAYVAERKGARAAKGSGGAPRMVMRGGLGARSTSAAPATTRASKGRSVSRARRPAEGDDDDDEDGDDDGRGDSLRERAMSPAPGGHGGASHGDEDDEVERRDRGEELVRKRMKDRARIKKEAEKASRKRDAAARLQLQETARRASYAPPPTDYDDFDPTTRPLSSLSAAPTSRTGDGSFLGLGLPQPPRSLSRGPSRSSGVGGGLRDSYASSSTVRAGDEEGGGTPTPGSPVPSSVRWPSQARSFSYASSTKGSEAGDREGGSGDEGEEEPDPFDENQLGYREGEEGYNDDDDDDDDAPDGDVEYTLKDRQDAINVEHPFGLPIWKPALYKKNRSITRNAETALHATPSSTALHHLAPGNILWTLFFGLWLALACVVVSAILWCVPWGGEKYGRVIWELGGYLFWPFGKYVEGWTDGQNDEEEEHDVAEGDDEDEQAPAARPDEESAGRTFGRGRGRDVSQRSRSNDRRVSVGDIWRSGSHQATDTLPDEPSQTNLTIRGAPSRQSLRAPNDERSGLVGANGASRSASYGATTGQGDDDEHKLHRSSSEDTDVDDFRPHDFSKDDDHSFRVRALGRLMYWVGFYLVVAPLMLLVCVLCWGMVFTIPMAKLLWVLLRHLSNEPLSLHFRSPPKYSPLPSAAEPSTSTTDTVNDAAHPHDSSAAPVGDGVQYPLRAGQRAPPVSRQSIASAKRHGRLFGPRSTVLLCTYRAAGLQYYKYTIDGVNIMFINLMSLVFFVIVDFFVIAPRVEEHHLGGLLGVVAGQGFIFVTALLSVIPLSYFIGMAVASISAQSSIGMGAVINASFGSIIEIILYCIALTQSKGELVEGSIVGSILAGVLLMPGLSMIGGAMRRKEQKFNAKSAGVTSTMLIMAIIGILTPTLFYEIYGSFQLSCTGCLPDDSGTSKTCSTCYYEHVDPADDPFYKGSVRILSYWCAIILVLSYLIGLWFSLRTHASQIWQNAQPKIEEGLAHAQSRPALLSATSATGAPGDRGSLYQRVLPSQLLGKRRSSTSGQTPLATPQIHPEASSTAPKHDNVPVMELPHGMTAADFHRAIEVVANVIPGVQARGTSHAREISGTGTITKPEQGHGDGHGGHDAPNWSRLKSASVLMGCTVLYAIIAEILVDVVDVVLDGSGIPEKLLGVTLFALVPNTTEFMNAISFAINGNIALSMEIGSAYALQVCLIQAPAMLAFSAYYAIGKESLLHRSFTLVFPRWDVIAILFSVFLLTYTYIEARANYYRGSILCLSYLVLLGGFAASPRGRDTSDNPGFTDDTFFALDVATSVGLSTWGHIQAFLLSIFTR